MNRVLQVWRPQAAMFSACLAGSRQVALSHGQFRKARMRACVRSTWHVRPSRAWPKNLGMASGSRRAARGADDIGWLRIYRNVSTSRCAYCTLRGGGDTSKSPTMRSKFHGRRRPLRANGMPVAALPARRKMLGALVILRIATHTGSAQNGVPTVRYHSCDLAPSRN
jgi:hypothetical protein